MHPRSLFLALVAAASLSACAPYRIDHRHLVLDETPGLVVIERSTTAVDSQGKPQFIHSATYEELVEVFGLSGTALARKVLEVGGEPESEESSHGIAYRA